MGHLGKILIVAGIVLFLVGVLFYWGEKLPWLGKLPGDVIIKKKNFTIYFPVASCLLISLLLTLVFFVLNKIK